MYSLFKITDHFAARSWGNFAHDVFHIAPQVIDAFRVSSVDIFLAISSKEKNAVGLDQGIEVSDFLRSTFQAYPSTIRRSCWFWSSSSILAADCVCFSKPADNVHNTFARWCSSNIKILLKHSLCCYNWIGSNKQSEYLDAFNRSMSLIFHFGRIWYQFLNYSVQKNWEFIPKLVSIIQSPNLRVWFKTTFNIISFISLKLSTI